MDERSKRISEAISKSGLSYPELEKITGISKSSLQRYATGATKKIPINCIESIAKATGTDAKHLMGWTDDSKKPPSSDVREQLDDICDGMTPEMQKELLKYAKYLHTMQQSPEIVEQTTIGAELDRRAATDAEAKKTAV